MQPYGYDRPLAFPPFLSTPSQKTPFFFYFRAVSPPLLPRHRPAFGLTALLNQSFITKKNYLLSNSSFPAWSALCSHSATLSAYSPRPPTSVALKYPSSGFTTCSFANKLASHLLSGRYCHPIPSSRSSFLRTLLLFSISCILHRGEPLTALLVHTTSTLQFRLPLFFPGTLQPLRAPLSAEKTVKHTFLTLVPIPVEFPASDGEYSNSDSSLLFPRFWLDARSKAPVS